MATPVTTDATKVRIPETIHIPNPGPAVPLAFVGRLEPRSLYIAMNRKEPDKINKPGK